MTARILPFSAGALLAAFFLPCANLTAAEPRIPATAPAAAIDLTSAPRPAIDLATQRFDESPEGRQCAAQMRDADARRDKAQAGGSDEDRREAAVERMKARSAYRLALRAALQRDPALREAAERERARSAASQPAATLNQQILAFAEAHLGQQVGNGECWTLADDAFRDAHTSHPDIYVWGVALTRDEPPIPGDIIQFTSVHLQDGDRWMNIGLPNHTAIIQAVAGPGKYTLLQQNFRGKTVSSATFDLTTKTSGEYVIYRPGPKAER